MSDFFRKWFVVNFKLNRKYKKLKTGMTESPSSVQEFVNNQSLQEELQNLDINEYIDENYSKSSTENDCDCSKNQTESSIDNENVFIKEQLQSLQLIVQTLQDELEIKNQALDHLLNEKERLQSDLKKYKQSSHNLRQQLEDERTFYFKEKEYYCKEMCISKQLRKKRSQEFKNVEVVMEQVKELESLRTENSNLKSVLNETNEAIYNLSIKFLRMKNTKYSLKARLKCEQTENAKIISNLTSKLQNTQSEILFLISDKFKSHIPPSNKKYLQVCKQNTQLIHENLDLQLQISKLHNNVERIKAEKIKSETNFRLQYVKNQKFRRKSSSDKICEANLCNECKSCPILFSEKPSECTISSLTEKDSDLLCEAQFPSFSQKFSPIGTPERDYEIPDT